MISKFKKILAMRFVKLLCFGVCLTVVLFAIPQPAAAFWSLSSIIVGFFVWPIYIMQFIATLFFSLAGYLAGLVLNFNYEILDGNAFIAIGWSILRDIANLGFVFFIIVIAIATILRYKEYGTQKALFTLIAAAIAVNFSLTIAGIFIDASHSLTKFFFAPIDATHNPFKIATIISGAFNPQNLFAEPEEPEPLDPDEEVGGFKKFSTAVLLQIAGAFFALIFTLIAAFVLFAYAIMLLLRYLWLSFLLIVSPIIYLMMIVPRQKKYWDEWWNKFISWTFFAPASAAFIYLALISIEKLNEGVGAVSPAEFFKNGAMQAIMQQGVNMIILCGLLIGGLWAAQSMGIGAANGFMGAMKKVSSSAKKWTKERAKQYGTRVATRPFRTQAARNFTNRLQTLGQNSRLGRVFGAPIRQMGRGMQSAAARGDKLIIEAKEKLKGKSHDQLAREVATADHAGRVARVQVLADDGKKMERERKQAQETLGRAERRRGAAQDELNSANASGNTGDIAKAQQALASAEQSVAEAQNSFNKVDSDFRNFEAALANLPNDIRDALRTANYDLTNVSSRGVRPRRYMATLEEDAATMAGRRATATTRGQDAIDTGVDPTSHAYIAGQSAQRAATAATLAEAQQAAREAQQAAVAAEQDAVAAGTDDARNAARAAREAARAAADVTRTRRKEYRGEA